jgi:peptidoglycan/xylan/chitin deacetylase (PgdA/CDA1 family)
MYHSIAPYERDPFQVTVSPERFAQQMRWLVRRGYRGASVRELLEPSASASEAGTLVGLTFDDGYADFIAGALPVLLEHGFTATVFVVAGRLGGQNGWDHPGPRKALMTADQLRTVAATGMEIGSHGLRHVPLTTVDAATLRAEVVESRAILEAVTGRPITGFGYPYGAAGAREVAAVESAGYGYGCAVARSAVTGPYALPRTYVGDRDGSLRLLAKCARHHLSEAAVR